MLLELVVAKAHEVVDVGPLPVEALRLFQGGNGVAVPIQILEAKAHVGVDAGNVLFFGVEVECLFKEFKGF